MSKTTYAPLVAAEGAYELFSPSSLAAHCCRCRGHCTRDDSSRRAQRRNIARESRHLVCRFDARSWGDRVVAGALPVAARLTDRRDYGLLLRRDGVGRRPPAWWHDWQIRG